jgi:hypothetical protein
MAMAARSLCMRLSPLTRKPYPLSFPSSLFLHGAGGGPSGDLENPSHPQDEAEGEL